jgi:drug/metabolite transporter (DMT)-like permease
MKAKNSNNDLPINLLEQGEVRMRAQKGHKSDGVACGDSKTAENSRMRSYFALGVVPLIWGTYSPLVKGMYSNPGISAPPGLLFNFLSYVCSFSFLTAASWFSTSNNKKDDTTSSTIISSSNTSSRIDIKSSGSDRKLSRLEIRAGIELGMWLYLGSTLQVMGIQGTSAVEASILVQLTTIIVPVLESIFTGVVLRKEKLLACILALVGVLTIEIDPRGLLEGGNLALSFSTGNLLVITSALFYSMHVVRLSAIAKDVVPIKLAQAKSATELVASIIVIVGSLALSRGEDITAYIRQGMDNGGAGMGLWLVVGTIVWNGVVATGLTTWAQTIGQQAASATTANLVYTTQPVWATLFSYLLLGDRVEPSVLLGGSIIMLGLLFSVLAEGERRRNGGGAEERPS